MHEHIKLDGRAVRDAVQNEMSRYQPDEPFRRNWEPPPPRPPRPPSRPWIWLALILAIFFLVGVIGIITVMQCAGTLAHAT